jgi:hypothetical protein
MKASTDINIASDNMHILEKNSGLDCGGIKHNWELCKVCGATKHSGHFWLGAYKSKTIPPCIEFPLDQTDLIEWQNKAKLRNYDLHTHQSDASTEIRLNGT